jgi:hypothetical protein
MGTSTFVEEFKGDLEFEPIDGQPNTFVIRPRNGQPESAKEKMTPEDWNEFERHITDAFEQIP